MDDEVIYLTKERLLKGAQQIEDVQTSMGIFKVRPLNDGEKARYDVLKVKGVKSSGSQRDARSQNLQMSLDMEYVIGNEWEATFYLLSCGLSISKAERFTVSDVKSINFPTDVKETLVNKIREISGMEEDSIEVLNQFPDGDGGSDPSESDPGGSD